jgi:hypothetical protein
MLFYNGLEDVSCNFLGTTRFLEQLEWHGAAMFAAAPTFGWKVGGPPHRQGRGVKEPEAASDETTTTGVGGDGSIVAGYTRSAGPLRLLYVHNSGHLVPMDQPAYALDLVSRYIHGRSFDDVATPRVSPSLDADVRGVDANAVGEVMGPPKKTKTKASSISSVEEMTTSFVAAGDRVIRRPKVTNVDAATATSPVGWFHALLFVSGGIVVGTVATLAYARVQKVRGYERIPNAPSSAAYVPHDMY